MDVELDTAPTTPTDMSRIYNNMKGMRFRMRKLRRNILSLTRVLSMVMHGDVRECALAVEERR